MSEIVHNAIIVSGGIEKHVTIARRKALEIFGITGSISLIRLSEFNLINSFFVPTNGSKEGWDEADAGDKKRLEFVNWLKSHVDEDGFPYLDWVEVRYGDRTCSATIIIREGK